MKKIPSRLIPLLFLLPSIVFGFQNPQGNVLTDTVICPGQPVQLEVSGGDSYSWSPTSDLSCTDCPNPVASPDATTLYTVDIVRNGQTTQQTVLVEVFEIALGPNITVCNDAAVTLNPQGQDYPGATYAWQGFPPNFSCTDCPSPVLEGLTTGIYFYFGFLTAPGCTLSDTIRIEVVNGQQPEYTIIPDATICEGDSIEMGGPAAMNTFYNWTSVPAGFVSNNANPKVSPMQTTKYLLTVNNGSCPQSVVDSVTIEVVPPILLNLPPNTTICEGTGIRLNGAPVQENVSYAWTPNDGSLNDTTLANPLARPEVNTTYIVTASNGGCIVMDTVTIDVSNIKIELDADTVFICKGGSAVVNVTNTFPDGAPINWAPLSDIVIESGGEKATLSPPVSRLYTATVAAPGCTRTDTVWAQVDSLPDDLTIRPFDTTVCQGSLVLLTTTVYEPSAYPDINILWTPPDGQQTPDSLFNMVVQPNDTTTYLRIVTNNGCIDTSEAVVNIIPTASMQVTPMNSIACPGDTVQLELTYDPGVTNISWEPVTGLSCTTCDTPFVVVQSTTAYTVSGEFMGCPVSAGAIVQAYPLPGYEFPADTKLCLGDTLRLNTIDDPQTTYSWTSTAPGFGTQTTATPTWVPDQSTASFFLDAVTVNGCRILDTLTVTYNEATLDVVGDTTICNGGSAVLRAITSVPGTYQWNTGQSSSTISVSPNSSQSYTVVFTYAGDCTLADIASVQVAPGPAVQFPPIQERQICLGESIELNRNPVPGAVYSWTSNPPGFTSNQPAPVVTSQVPTTYTVEATLGICTETRSVTIAPLSAVVTASNDTTICAGEEVTLMASVTGSGGGSFTWTPPGRTGTTITETPDSTTAYVVRYAFGPGCEAFDTVNVTVTPSFELSINSVPDTNRVSLGQQITLMAVVEPTQNISNFNFTWEEVVPSQEVIGTGEEISYVPSVNEDSTLRIVLTAISPQGCEKRTALDLIIVQPLVFFPNVFSPNGDNINDVFRPAVVVGEIFIEQLDIYNRWGQKVYSGTDANAEWNGEVDGKPAPSDVYVYYVQYRRGDGSLLVDHGDVTLLR